MTRAQTTHTETGHAETTGTHRDPVIVRAADPGWPAEFAALAAPVRAALGPLALGVEHVGSTSVPGLAAKPVIDLDVVISSRLTLPPVLERLSTLGYVHRGDLGIPGREAFHWPEHLPRHHLYVCAVDAVPLHEHLLFRDHLRAHPAEAAAYGTLKRALAERYRGDRVRYGEAKTEFVRAALARAGRPV